MPLGRVERRQAPHSPRQANRAERGGEEDDGGHDQWREIDRAVFPQLTPDGPVHWARLRHRRRRDRSLVEGIIHRDAPCAVLPMTATNRSAMLVVPTSPTAPTCSRSARSNSTILRPNT